jgi:hypothetical protein
MFAFVMEDLPPQALSVEAATITLFAQVPPWRDRISLHVEITATEATVMDPAGENSPYVMQPTFYTEWLDIPLSALKGRGLDLLDGYQMAYDVATEAEDGFDQFPGAVQQDSHAGFQRATMTLTHLGGTRYRIEAEGVTEFGWTFRIDTVGRLTGVAAKSGQVDGDKAPSAEVEDWYGRMYDASAFPPTWSRKGNDEFYWYVYESQPLTQ